MHQHDTNTCLSYIRPDQCTKRHDELKGVKRVEALVSQLQGSTPKTAHKAECMVADIQGDLQLLWALQRRGLAYDQANLLEFALRDAWVRYLIHRPFEDTRRGYKPPGRAQLLLADQKLFLLLAEDSRAGIVAKPGGDRP